MIYALNGVLSGFASLGDDRESSSHIVQREAVEQNLAVLIASKKAQNLVLAAIFLLPQATHRTKLTLLKYIRLYIQATKIRLNLDAQSKDIIRKEVLELLSIEEDRIGHKITKKVVLFVSELVRSEADVAWLCEILAVFVQANPDSKLAGQYFEARRRANLQNDNIVAELIQKMMTGLDVSKNLHFIIESLGSVSQESLLKLTPAFVQCCVHQFANLNGDEDLAELLVKAIQLFLEKTNTRQHSGQLFTLWCNLIPVILTNIQ